MDTFSLTQVILTKKTTLICVLVSIKFKEQAEN